MNNFHFGLAYGKGDTVLTKQDLDDMYELDLCS